MDNKIIERLLIFVVILCLGSLSLSGLMFYKQYVEDEKEDVTTEDGVIIAGEYEVLSTKAISDAYKNGTENSLNDKDKETLQMALDVIDSVINEDMDDFSKEKAIYDWMNKTLGQDRGLLTVIPSSGEDSDKPYGVLKYKNAVCVGYATTFRFFMELLDIPCMVVHESGLYHTWDLVKIEDEWYHVDVFSSVGSGGYAYFNLTDDMVIQNWDREFFPAANSLKYNMAYMNATKCKSPMDVPGIIREAIDNKDSLCSMIFPKRFTEDDAKLVSKLLTAIQSYLWNVENLSETYVEGSFYPIEEGYLYAVKINYNNSDSDVELDPEKVLELSNIANEAFSDLGGGEITIDTSYDGDVIYEEEEKIAD